MRKVLFSSVPLATARSKNRMKRKGRKICRCRWKREEEREKEKEEENEEKDDEKEEEEDDEKEKENEDEKEQEKEEEKEDEEEDEMDEEEEEEMEEEREEKDENREGEESGPDCSSPDEAAVEPSSLEENVPETGDREKVEETTAKPKISPNPEDLVSEDEEQKAANKDSWWFPRFQNFCDHDLCSVILNQLKPYISRTASH